MEKGNLQKGGISEVLEGTNLQNSGIQFAFRRNVDNVPLCEMYSLFLMNCLQEIE